MKKIDIVRVLPLNMDPLDSIWSKQNVNKKNVLTGHLQNDIYSEPFIP